MLVQDWRHQVIEWEFLELEVEEQEHSFDEYSSVIEAAGGNGGSGVVVVRYQLAQKRSQSNWWSNLTP